VGIAIIRGVFTAGFAAATLATATWADQGFSLDARVLFKPVPINWNLASFDKMQVPRFDWDANWPEANAAWAGNYPGPLSSSNFSSPDAGANAPPPPINEIALGNFLLRFDATRNYNDSMSGVTDYAQSPDSPDFKPLFQPKHKRSAFSIPYLGFRFTTPTIPSTR